MSEGSRGRSPHLFRGMPVVVVLASSHRWRGEAFAVVAREDFLVRLVVVGEAIVLGIPTQFLAGKTGCLHREEGGFSDA